MSSVFSKFLNVGHVTDKYVWTRTPYHWLKWLFLRYCIASNPFFLSAFLGVQEWFPMYIELTFLVLMNNVVICKSRQHQMTAGSRFVSPLRRRNSVPQHLILSHNPLQMTNSWEYVSLEMRTHGEDRGEVRKNKHFEEINIYSFLSFFLFLLHFQNFFQFSMFLVWCIKMSAVFFQIKLTSNTMQIQGF